MGTSINFVELESATTCDLSIVLPVYNEAEALPAFLYAIIENIRKSNISVQLVIVDDGSTDDTIKELANIDFANMVVVRHLMNLGHQQAILTGLQVSTGKYIGMMDADGQHPIPDLLAMYEIAQKNNLDLVQGIRRSRKTDPFFKKTTARIFYHFMRTLTRVDFPKNAADFRVLSNYCKNILLSISRPLPLRFSVHALSVNKDVHYFDVTTRLAGSSKYNFRKMLNLAFSSITNFSDGPLRFISWMGIITSLISVALLIFTIISSLLGNTITGWASLATLITFLGAIILLCLGVLAIYLTTILDKDSNMANVVSVVLWSNDKQV